MLENIQLNTKAATLIRLVVVNLINRDLFLVHFEEKEVQIL